MKHGGGLMGLSLTIIEIVYWVSYGQWLTGQFSQQIETLMIVGGIIPIVLLLLYFGGGFDEPKQVSKQQNVLLKNGSES